MKTKMKHKITLSVFIFAFLLTGCGWAYVKWLERVEAEGIPLVVPYGTNMSKTDYGFVNVSFFFRNTSGRTFKYVVFTLVAYNAVGDIIHHSYKGSSVDIKYTGPLQSGSTSTFNGTWEKREGIWLNRSISCVEIVGAEITYMNNRTEYLTTRELSKMVYELDSNTCKI